MNAAQPGGHPAAAISRALAVCTENWRQASIKNTAGEAMHILLADDDPVPAGGLTGGLRRSKR